MEKENPASLCIYLLGALVSALGAAVMLAWQEHWAALTQIRADFVPMQFNTALCFFLSGISLLTARAPGLKRLASIGCAIIIGLIAGCTALQYVLGVDLGIDRLFVDPYITTKVLYPGRMAPHTAFCVILHALSLLCWHFLKKNEARLFVVILFDTIVLLLNLFAFTGYFLPSETAYGWWGGGHIAPHTALGLLAGSIALLILAIGANPDLKTSSFPKWKPALTAALGIALTILIGQGVFSAVQKNAARMTNETLTRTAQIIQMELDNDMNALRRMSSRWNGDNTPVVEWLKDAANYNRDNPVYFSLALSDSQSRVFKVIPEDSAPVWADPAIQSKIGVFEMNRTMPFIFDPKHHASSSIIILGFPLYDGKVFDGFLLIAYHIQKKMDTISHHLQGGYSLTLTDSTGLIFSNPPIQPYSRSIEKTVPINVLGQTWYLRLTADASQYQDNNLILFVLIAGTGLSLLIAYTMWQNNKIYRFADDLSQSDERYAFALEAAGVGLWDWDPEQDKVVWGANSWRIFGARSNDDITDKVFEARQMIPESDLAYIDRQMADALAARRGFSIEYRMKRLDGRDIWVQSRGKAMIIKDGTPVRISGILTDITERKAIEHQAQLYQARLEAILDNMVDGLITIDEQGIVQSYNKPCEQIFGYEAGEVIGQNVKMLMPQNYAAGHDQYLRHYRDTGEARIIGIGRELEGRRKDGSLFPMDLSIAEVVVDSKRFFSGIVRDITERKKAETALLHSNKELEKFAYVASHDLKAPLRNIDDLAKWIIEDHYEILPPEAMEKLELLCGRVEGLEALLDDILSYSRAGRIVDNPVDIDMQEMLDRLVQIHVPASFKVRLPDNLPTIFSFRTPLEQVFGNILSNAVKHHDRNEGSLSIEIHASGSFYEFIVRDDGPGIVPEFHERVFQMFQTLKSRDKVSGSGLGMAIIKKLVEWQGGRIWIESDGKNRGTAIHFLWPQSADTKTKIS